MHIFFFFSPWLLVTWAMPHEHFKTPCQWLLESRLGLMICRKTHWAQHTVGGTAMIYDHERLLGRSSRKYPICNIQRELSALNHILLSLSVLSDFAALWTVACQPSLCMEFSRQEYCSGVPFPTPGDLPDPGIEPVSSALAGRFLTSSTTQQALIHISCSLNENH